MLLVTLPDFCLAKWQKETNTALLIHMGRFIPLQEGDYIFVIHVGLDGRQKTLKPALLHIGKTETEMLWNKEMADKLLM